MNTLKPQIMKTRAALTALGRGALLACAALLACGSGALAASSAPPDSMTYQGFLVDANGNALAQASPQNYPIAFRIYNAPSGGTPLWSEQQIVTVDKGSFSVLLGEGTAIGGELRPALSSVFSGATASDRYISAWVTIGGATTEVLPRLRLVPSPYSFLATSAANLVQPDGSAFVNFSGGRVNIVGGNVGIGTSAAGKRLQIGDASTPNSEGMIRLASRSGAGGATRTWDLGVPETDENTTGTGYSFVIDDTSRAGTEFMVQFGSGNVGIGTASPNALLSLGSGLANTKLALWDAAPGSAYGFGIQSSQFRMHVSNPADDFLFLNAPAGAEIMRIKGNGNVGIGTANPAARLDVNGNIQLGNSQWLQARNNAGAIENVFWPRWSDDVTYLNYGNGGFHIRNNSSETTMFMLDNGNVGIGTTSPGRPLQIGGPFGTEGMIRLVSSAFNGAGRAWDVGVPKDEASTSGKFFSFTIQDTASADPALLIRWDSAFVGIGTTNPAAKLDVRGNIKLGSSGQFSAAAGDENLRIIRGKVRLGAGNPLVPVTTSGSGFTITRLQNYNNGNAGVLAVAYRISFTTPFADAPAVTVSVTQDAASAFTAFHFVAKVEFTSASEAVVSFYNPGTSVTDSPFSFIAVGAR